MPDTGKFSLPVPVATPTKSPDDMEEEAVAPAAANSRNFPRRPACDAKDGSTVTEAYTKQAISDRV